MRPRSSTAPYSRPRRFLNLGDQVLKGGSHSGLMLSQIDRSLPQAGEVSLGEVLRVVPNHVCATVNMHDEISYGRRGQVEGTWKVAARGRVR